MNIGDIIRAVRKESGISQGDLANSCNLSQAYLSQIEKNRKDPHLSSLKKICNALGIPLPILMFLSVEKEDIPAQKQEAFSIIYPSIRAFLIQLFPKIDSVVD